MAIPRAMVARSMIPQPPMKAASSGVVIPVPCKPMGPRLGRMFQRVGPTRAGVLTSDSVRDMPLLPELGNSFWMRCYKDAAPPALPPNDPSSATRPAGCHDCNRDAMAGFTAAHG